MSTTIETAVPKQQEMPIRQPLQRLESLDVFRGLTIAGMILVNDPGTWSAIYWPLAHADELMTEHPTGPYPGKWQADLNGLTPTDLILAFFLCLLSITSALSLVIQMGRGY